MSGKLKEVRERIGSVKSTQQITSAMKMVSAAKLRKAQQAITEMRPYADRLNRMMINILSNIEGGGSTSFGQERERVNVAVVVITSNRGLCGAFNSNVIKAAAKKIEEDYKGFLQSGNCKIITIGKKGYDSLKRTYPESAFIKDHISLFDDLSFDKVSQVSQGLMDAFTLGEYDEVYVCYGRFKNPVVQYPTCVRFLPVEKLPTPTEGAKEKSRNADYIFEPSKEELLEKLIPSILQTSFHKYCLENRASEHGARMSAMDSATENAKELLKELKINYNKARQESITNEILEIVGGAAALEDG